MTHRTASLSLLSVLLAAALGSSQAAPSAAPPTHTVQAQTAGGVQRVEGVVEAERQAVLSVPVQGAVTELKLRAGDAETREQTARTASRLFLRSQSKNSL